MANSDIIRRVDDWSLRCRFNNNSEEYKRLLQAGVLVEIEKRIGTPKPDVDLPPGSKSVEVRYLDAKTQKEVLKYHKYVRPDGSLGGSGRPDPKRLKDLKNQAIWYRRKEGEDESVRDPCLLFPNDRGRLWYVNFRRWCCQQLGPDNEAMIAAVTTPILRCFSILSKA